MRELHLQTRGMSPKSSAGSGRRHGFKGKQPEKTACDGNATHAMRFPCVRTKPDNLRGMMLLRWTISDCQLQPLSACVKLILLEQPSSRGFIAKACLQDAGVLNPQQHTLAQCLATAVFELTPKQAALGPKHLHWYELV